VKVFFFNFVFTSSTVHQIRWIERVRKRERETYLLLFLVALMIMRVRENGWSTIIKIFKSKTMFLVETLITFKYKNYNNNKIISFWNWIEIYKLLNLFFQNQKWNSKLLSEERQTDGRKSLCHDQFTYTNCYQTVSSNIQTKYKSKKKKKLPLWHENNLKVVKADKEEEEEAKCYTCFNLFKVKRSRSRRSKRT